MNCCCPCGADKKTAICAYLREHHTGKSRAIHSEDLQRLFCLYRLNGMVTQVSNARTGLLFASAVRGFV